jgi:enamine deaminase RidA (YjgF/YER057c/UK114 family)
VLLWSPGARANARSPVGTKIIRETRHGGHQNRQPDALGKPLGQYSHLTRVKASEYIFIAGQVGVDKAGKIVSEDFDAQCVQTFANIEAALKSCGAGWGNIVQFTTYMVHSQDIPKFMKYRLREFPKMFTNGAYPPNTLLMIDRLVQEGLLVEVQAVAAL